MTLRQDRETQRVKMRGKFLRLLYSKACLTRLNINNLCTDQKLCLEPSSDNRKSADSPRQRRGFKKESSPLHPGSLRTGLLPAGGELQK